MSNHPRSVGRRLLGICFAAPLPPLTSPRWRVDKREVPGTSSRWIERLNWREPTIARPSEPSSTSTGSDVEVHQSLTKALGPDSMGNEAAQNVNHALSNLNTTTGNMSDDTEALKRNFFFRGFFRNRGCYNLISIPPGEYRRGRLFAVLPIIVRGCRLLNSLP
jgi:hypothetical protein